MNFSSLIKHFHPSFASLIENEEKDISDFDLTDWSQVGCGQLIYLFLSKGDSVRKSCELWREKKNYFVRFDHFASSQTTFCWNWNDIHHTWNEMNWRWTNLSHQIFQTGQWVIKLKIDSLDFTNTVLFLLCEYFRRDAKILKSILPTCVNDLPFILCDAYKTFFISAYSIHGAVQWIIICSEQ